MTNAADRLPMRVVEEIPAGQEETWAIFAERLPMATRLTLRRVILGYSIRKAALGCGVSLQAARKAHSVANRQYPFVRDAQQKLSDFYAQEEVRRGYRSAPGDVRGDGGESPNG